MLHLRLRRPSGLSDVAVCTTCTSLYDVGCVIVDLLHPYSDDVDALSYDAHYLVAVDERVRVCVRALCRRVAAVCDDVEVDSVVCAALVQSLVTGLVSVQSFVSSVKSSPFMMQLLRSRKTRKRTHSHFIAIVMKRCMCAVDAAEPGVVFVYLCVEFYFDNPVDNFVLLGLVSRAMLLSYTCARPAVHSAVNTHNSAPSCITGINTTYDTLLDIVSGTYGSLRTMLHACRRVRPNISATVSANHHAITTTHATYN